MLSLKLYIGRLPQILILLAITFILSDKANAVQWDLSVYYALNSNSSEIVNQFAKEIAEATNGDVEIVIRAAGELPYSPAEYHRAVGNGELAMADTFFITADIPAAGALTSVFLVRSYDEIRPAVDAVWPQIVEQLAEYGVEPLFYGAHAPARMWGTGEAVVSLEGIRGRKVRVLSSEQGLLMSELGANPVTITTPEVMTALQYGTVDSVLTSPNGVVANSWNSAFEWSFDLSMSMLPTYIIVSKEKMAELSPENQDAIRKISAKYTQMYLDQIEKHEALATESLAAGGISMSSPTEAENERLVELARPIWDGWASARGDDAQEAIRTIRSALGR